MRLLVLDPGGTTGWCFMANGEITGGSFPLWSDIPYLINRFKPNAILYETFILRAGAAKRLIGNNFPAAQVIGVIRYLASDNNIACYSQSPSMRVGITLKRIPNMDRHALDALKHGIRYHIKYARHEYDYLRTKRRV